MEDTMSFADFLREDQRLVMLRFLAEMPSYSSNSSVIYQALTRYGHAPSRDQVKTELRWLEDQGLLRLDDIETVLVARLTERGADVAAGRAIVPGVKRPGAGADMGRKSTIHKLPTDVRSHIERRLREDQLTLDELLSDIRQHFPDTDETPSRSALGRYKQSFGEMVSRMREQDQMARLLVSELGKPRRTRRGLDGASRHDTHLSCNLCRAGATGNRYRYRSSPGTCSKRRSPGT